MFCIINVLHFSSKIVKIFSVKIKVIFHCSDITTLLYYRELFVRKTVFIVLGDSYVTVREFTAYAASNWCVTIHVHSIMRSCHTRWAMSAPFRCLCADRSRLFFSVRTYNFLECWRGLYSLFFFFTLKHLLNNVRFYR